MIDLVCPECGEEMEISDRMRGRRVECIECGRRISVPDRPRRRRRREVDDEGLSSNEYLLYSLLFLFIPGANVIVSSVLYYMWKRDHPRRANQINTLGFIIFGFNILIAIIIVSILNRR
jgi:DNA-directed RNA polymerase subunit RPC12/RpoP